MTKRHLLEKVFHSVAKFIFFYRMFTQSRFIISIVYLVTIYHQHCLLSHCFHQYCLVIQNMLICVRKILLTDSTSPVNCKQGKSNGTEMAVTILTCKRFDLTDRKHWFPCTQTSVPDLNIHVVPVSQHMEFVVLRNVKSRPRIKQKICVQKSFLFFLTLLTLTHNNA